MNLQHLFVPHHSNNHRARALHLDALLVYVLMFAIFNFSIRLIHRARPDVLGYATNIHVTELLSQTNAKRAEAGLPPLTLNTQLSQAAAGKAADMFSKNYWAHIASDGTTPWDFIIGAGYNYSLAGENLAKNFQNSSEVVSAWMASPTHRENIMKATYKEIGLAVVNGVLNGEETTLVVQMFGTRPGGVEVAQAPPQAPEIEVAPAESVVEVAQTDEVVEDFTGSAEAVQERDELAIANPMVVNTAQLGTQNIAQLPTQFMSAKSTPLLNIPSVVRDVTLVFGGIFVGILVLDLWIVTRKKIVRATGHNLAHFAFLLAILFGIQFVFQGSIL